MAPTRDEIDAVLNACYEQFDQGTSKYPGMTFEEGVAQTILWMRGDSYEPPMEIE